MKEEFIQAFETGLNKLRNEVEEYGSDEAFWSVPDGVANSAGNLCLHLLGNLNHYVGAKLGETGYVRDRPSEFSSKDVARDEILQKIDQTIATVKESLVNADLAAEYPNDEGEEQRGVGGELLRIVTHLNYHLGQINYHRRLISRK